MHLKDNPGALANSRCNPLHRTTSYISDREDTVKASTESAPRSRIYPGENESLGVSEERVMKPLRPGAGPNHHEYITNVPRFRFVGSFAQPRNPAQPIVPAQGNNFCFQMQGDRLGGHDSLNEIVRHRCVKTVAPDKEVNTGCSARKK